jgi:hypothetical protein
MLSCLTENKPAMLKADAYVRHIVSSLDEDSYLDICAPTSGGSAVSQYPVPSHLSYFALER